ncbi:hypothetical protein [Cellulomonas hominis]
MADVRAVVGVLREADTFRAAAAAVQVLDAAEHVDGQRCDSLGRVPAITAAGAVRAGEPLTSLNLPSMELAVYEVTPGLLQLLAAAPTAAGNANATTVGTGMPTAAGVWLSADLAQALGAQPGDRIETSAGTATIGGVYDYPDDGRSRTLAFALLSPVAATGSFDQCWAEVWPTQNGISGLLRTALDGDHDAAATAQQAQLNASRGTGYDAPAMLSGRSTRQVPLVAGGLGLALGFVAVRIRRLELAAALHARIPGPLLAWQVLAETAAWVAAAAVVSTAAIGWAAAYGSPDPGLETWAVGLRTVGVGSSAVALGSLVAVSATRERHLFRYFKNR